MMLQASLSPSSVQRAKGPSGPAPGDYWAADAYGANPIQWLPTTVFNDGSPGDQSTYESATANGIGSIEECTVARVWATPQGLNSVSVRACVGEGFFNWVVERWTGSAWSTDFNSGVAVRPEPFQPTWVTVTQSLNPALTTTMIRVSIRSMTESGGGEGTVLSVGDLRTS